MNIKKQDLDNAVHVRALIDKNYYYNYTIEELARSIGSNQSKLKAAFNLIAGRPLHEYLVWTRIERAKEMLENTEYTIHHIAKQIGLDRSNLNRQFKKITGTTPGKWRKSTAENNRLQQHIYNKARR